MTTTPRFRSRSFAHAVVGNAVYTSGDEYAFSRTVGKSEECDDYLSNGSVVNPFSLKKVDSSAAFASGQTADRTISNWPLAYPDHVKDPVEKFGEMSPTRISELSWETLANTNPNVPSFDGPSELGELRDIPSLFKSWGNSLIQKLSTYWLIQKWMIGPMLDTMDQLENFENLVNARIKELNLLANGKELRRRAHLGKNTSPYDLDTTLYLESQHGMVIRAWRFTSYSEEVWGTVQWVMDPDYQLPVPGTSGFSDLAKRLVTGATSHAAFRTAWELLPWSWLIDWFSNVGSLIDATDNTVPLTAKNIAIMRRMEAKSSYGIWSQPDWVTVSGVPADSMERKERYVGYLLPLPSIGIPVMDFDKWSVLYALAFLRSPGKNFEVLKQD